MNQDNVNVLLFEDDSDFTEVMKQRLASAKNPAFSLESVTSLSEGLARLSKGGIDLILLDLKLKDSAGLQTLTKVQARAENLPIIVLTGQYDESVGPEALKLGAQDFFLKGRIEVSALTRSMRYAIERKRNEQELKEAYTKIKQLYDVIPSILIGISPENKITHWNNVAEQTLGVSFMDTFDKRLADCGIEWDASILEKGASECRQKKAPVRLEEDVPFKRPDGKQGLLGFTINPVKDLRGDATDVLLYGADVTERRRIEARLRQFESR